MPSAAGALGDPISSVQNSLTPVTSTYAVRPRKAMSATPPPITPAICSGRPSAYVVTVPRLGSIRWIRPSVLSVTYRAPSGPTVLPEPQMSSAQGPSTKVASSVTLGVPDWPSAALPAAGTPGARSATASVTANASLLVHDMSVSLSVRSATIAPGGSHPRRSTPNRPT